MAVGACGISCDACGLYEKKICCGCTTGDTVSKDMLDKIPCPVLKCAAEKKIGYCSKDCDQFPCKIHNQEYPFSKAYLGMYTSRNK